MRALYQGWLGHQNLGDEALFEACVRNLPRLRWKSMPFDDPPPRRITSSTARNVWTRCAARLVRDQRAMLGGGTIINRTEHWLDQYRMLRRTSRRPVPLFAPGVADPAFWSGVPGWNDTRAGWHRELAGLPEIGVRGPQSKRLLDEAGFRNVIAVGDPVISFHRGRVESPPPGRRTVAVNAGVATGLMWGSEARAIAALGAAVQRLTRGGFRVRLFPMWRRDEAACGDVARAAGLPDDSVDPLVLDPDAFLRYLDGFDVVVSFKLHAAVLAAAAGVPFVAIEYQPKVRDFTESIGWSDLTFRSDALQASDIERAVCTIAGDLSAYRDRLRVRVEELAESFRSYARRIEDLLLAA